MPVIWISLVVICAVVPNSWTKKTKEQAKFFDPIFENWKRQSDLHSLPFQRVTQLYSRNSGNHIRILPNRKIDAQGEDGNEYAKLIIESDSFGRVRIQGVATKFYLCMDKRKRLRARPNGQGKAGCTFQEHFASNAYTEFTSVKKGRHFIAFNRRGRQRPSNKTRSEMKAVQFIERPLRTLRLYRGRKYLKNGRIDMNSGVQGPSVCITLKTWREWKAFLKWRKQRRKANRKLRRKGKKGRKRLRKNRKKLKGVNKKAAKKLRKGLKVSTPLTPTPLSTTQKPNGIAPKN